MKATFKLLHRRRRRCHHAVHCVSAGDPYQLPPTVLSNDRAATPQLAVSVFETVFAKCDARYMCSGTRTRAMLEVQYRMHGLICGWSSREFYGNRLVLDASVAAHLCTDLPAVARTELTGVAFCVSMRLM
ncbi:DNA polymerase alpha-associated DNA helicase A [Diplonema papillatum]|nr:DNA polymerase alpha-associated DNA helicase A [Diplonema papillatum]